jgi:hypothetical protein
VERRDANHSQVIGGMGATEPGAAIAWKPRGVTHSPGGSGVHDSIVVSPPSGAA